VSGSGQPDQHKAEEDAAIDRGSGHGRTPTHDNVLTPATVHLVTIAPKPPPLRLAELVATLSLGTDLGLGQPMEHIIQDHRAAHGRTAGHRRVRSGGALLRRPPDGLAARLGLGDEVRQSLKEPYERWDGKGAFGARGEEIRRASRLIILADVVAVSHGIGGLEAPSPAELQTALRRHAIGEEVRLRIERDGESRDVVVRHASDLP
jgi:hypothetical protein